MFELSPVAFFICCPLVFLAGLVDAIGGGGGLISLPAFVLAGLPMHIAIGTNKVAAMCGTALATTRFAKNKLINFKLAFPSVICAIAGSFIGSNLSLRIDEQILRIALIAVLPVVAFIVLNKKIFHDNPDSELKLDRKTYVVVCASAFLIGIYDGLYGPGTGTFLIIAFTVLAGMSIEKANGQCKAINLATNVTSAIVFFGNGTVILPLALACAVCNMLGGFIGSGLVMKNGGKIVKPVIIIVLGLLTVKIISDLI